MNFLLSVLIKFATSKTAEQLIAVLAAKLVNSTDSGITKELATTMINGIVASKRNPTTKEVFKGALKTLGK